VNCFIYVVSIATCRPTLFLLTMKEILLVYNYKISGCTQNVVYTLATKSFNDLEIVLPRPQSGLGDNFSLGSSRFRILDIQITICATVRETYLK
jgi:hypothetical protein